MAFCACFKPAESSDTEPKDVSKPGETELRPLSSARRSGSKFRASGELPTLAEHPEEDKDAQVNCSFPSKLLVNASTLSKNFSEKQLKDDFRPRQRLSDINIMASYDSVLMDTDTGSIRSSKALSSRNGRDGEDEEDYDDFGTPQWTIDPHDIFFVARNDSSSKVCRIGRGEHGPVYLGVWQERDVAVKLSKQRPTSYRAERQFHAKVAQLYGISHPNIVKFFGACFWKGGKRCVALTEYMEKGSLTSMLERPPPSGQPIRPPLSVALDVAKGLAHLHDIGVVHGRVKASNVLFCDSGEAKVAVPCLSTLLNHVKTNSQRTKNQGFEPMTVAPEIAQGASKSMAADVYCFGIIMWRLLTKENSFSVLRPIRSPDEASSKIAWLVESCLDADPESRPSARMIVSILKNAAK